MKFCMLQILCIAALFLAVCNCWSYNQYAISHKLLGIGRSINLAQIHVDKHCIAIVNRFTTARNNWADVDKRNHLIKYSVFSSIRRWAPLSFLFFLASIPTAVFAKVASHSASNVVNPTGWDIYGRVPFDDWLFSTDKLIEPNLLRRTMQEAVGPLVIPLRDAFTDSLILT